MFGNMFGNKKVEAVEAAEMTTLFASGLVGGKPLVLGGLAATAAIMFTTTRLRNEEGAAKAANKERPPDFLQTAYHACGLATTAAWTTVVLTTIRSNQPAGK